MRILAITGGKGGVGKTTISINLAVCLARMQQQTLLFDADFGLANVDVLLGLKPSRNISHVLNSQCDLQDVCINGPHQLKIIPSASGMQELAELSSHELASLIQSFSTLTDDVDYMLVDMASGISTQVIDVTHASQDIILVVCNDPASLMDSYAVMKILHKKYARCRFGIIVNKVKNDYEAYEVFNRFQDAAAKFINISLQYLGNVPVDDLVQMAARERVSIVDKFPQAPSTKAFENICHKIFQWKNENQFTGGIQFFFEKLIQSRAREGSCKV